MEFYSADIEMFMFGWNILYFPLCLITHFRRFTQDSKTFSSISWSTLVKISAIAFKRSSWFGQLKADGFPLMCPKKKKSLGSGLDCNPDATGIRLLRPRCTFELAPRRRTRILHVDQPTFQSFSTSPQPNILDQTGHKSISEDFCAVHCPFEYIKKTVDPMNRPKDRNQALFRVNFLLNSLRKLLARGRQTESRG
jgi:hypothetical protein